MPLTIASDTIAFMPWMSDTTVTMDETATMLPSTVMNDRSLFAQTARSAMRDRLEDLVHVRARRGVRCRTAATAARARSVTRLLPDGLAVGSVPAPRRTGP